MKRVVLTVAAVLALAACSSAAERSDPQSSDTWSSYADPQTGRLFRCLIIWRSAPHKGGPAMWCYES